MQSNIHFKKFAKDRDKKKEETEITSEINHSFKEKEEFAGIDIDYPKVYASQIGISEDSLSEEICSLLSEDINHKLRTIIGEALVKARLSGHNSISSSDINETFAELNVEKVYGAPSSPVWVKQNNFLLLQDHEVNLYDLINERTIRCELDSTKITKTWYVEDNEIWSNYFKTVCETILNEPSEESRLKLMKNISKDPNVGPIIDWFYNFAFLILSESLYDSYLPTVLKLIQNLEYSPLTSTNVSNKQLKLLIRILISRILINTDENLIKLMCSTLSTLCLRDILLRLVVTNLCDILNNEEYKNSKIQSLYIINSLGFTTIQEVFLPNIKYFLSDHLQENLFLPLLETYSFIKKSNISIQNEWFEKLERNFMNLSIVFTNFPTVSKEVRREPINFVSMKSQLIKTRRTVYISKADKNKKISIKDVFNLPPEESLIGKKLKEHEFDVKTSKKRIIIGKTTLMLSVLQQARKKCITNTNFNLISYNF